MLVLLCGKLWSVFVMDILPTAPLQLHIKMGDNEKFFLNVNKHFYDAIMISRYFRNSCIKTVVRQC